MQTAQTIEQGSLCTPREPIKFGRTMAARGQTFWVTSPAYIRASSGAISIARSGRSAAHAVALSLADFDRYFEPLAK
jgi:hypothetical protein